MVGRLYSAITLLLDSMMSNPAFPCYSSIVVGKCFRSSIPLLVHSLVNDNSPREMGLGNPVMGMKVMLGIYTKYNEYLSV